MSSPKLRILCLHGYHGSGRVLSSQIAGLAEVMSPRAELVFVDAPSQSEGDFGWWHAREQYDGSMRYEGWKRSRDWLVKLFEEEGPFDGVFGFSQGAALTGLLVGLRAPDDNPTAEHPLVFHFAMMVGGFETLDPALLKLYESKNSYAIPSVHIIGRSDWIVPPTRQELLASMFVNPLVLRHMGGHVIASTSDIRQKVGSFLETQQNQKRDHTYMKEGGNEPASSETREEIQA